MSDVHKLFTVSDKDLVNTIVGHPSPSSAENAAIAEMQRRQMDAVRDFNAASARQATVMIRLTWAVAVLTLAMAFLGWAQLRRSESSLQPAHSAAESWHGFYYPLRDAARLPMTAEQFDGAPTFRDLQTCIAWGHGRIQGQADAAFECGTGCRFDSRASEVICRDTTRLIGE